MATSLTQLTTHLQRNDPAFHHPPCWKEGANYSEIRNYAQHSPSEMLRGENHGTRAVDSHFGSFRAKIHPTTTTSEISSTWHAHQISRKDKWIGRIDELCPSLAHSFGQFPSSSKPIREAKTTDQDWLDCDLGTMWSSKGVDQTNTTIRAHLLVLRCPTR